jgi:hypothetical protein
LALCRCETRGSGLNLVGFLLNPKSFGTMSLKTSEGKAELLLCHFLTCGKTGLPLLQCFPLQGHCLFVPFRYPGLGDVKPSSLLLQHPVIAFLASLLELKLHLKTLHLDEAVYKILLKS